MECGIYIIKNLSNKKIYIGSAVNIKSRWQRHRKDLRKNKHHSKILQRAWNKYGEESFKFEILQEVKHKEHLLAYEQVYLDYYKSYESNMGYNICRTAGSQLGCIRTEESKKKTREAALERPPRKGPVHSAETIEYLRKINTGRVVSEKTRQKLRERLSGKNAPNYGKKFSAETCAKIRIASSKRRHTQATKEKMGKTRKGKKHNQATKDKMSTTQREMHKNNRGYTFDKDKGKYRVKLWINGVKIHIGYFSTEEEAIRAVELNSTTKNQDLAEAAP